MQKYNPKYHHRRSIRLKDYDYAKEGLYFITLCVQDRANLFGKVEKGEMKLNAFGIIAEEEWLNTPNIRSNIVIHEHIIMPNHIHGIIEILFNKGHKNKTGEFKSPSQSIGAIVRGYKIATIKRIKDYIKRAEESSFSIENPDESFSSKENSEDSSFSRTNSGESSFSGISTGELQFAPTAPTNKILKLKFKIWQRNYYDIIIRDEKAFNNISNYIINNPKKWEEDKFNRKI